RADRRESLHERHSMDHTECEMPCQCALTGAQRMPYFNLGARIGPLGGSDGDFEWESAGGSPPEEGLDSKGVNGSYQAKGGCFDHLSHREGQADPSSKEHAEGACEGAGRAAREPVPCGRGGAGRNETPHRNSSKKCPCPRRAPLSGQA